MLARIPSAERRTAWLRVARQPYSEAELDESRAVLTGMVEQMEAMMTGGWLVGGAYRSEEHTSELQSLMRSSYAVFCLKKKTQTISTVRYIILVTRYLEHNRHRSTSEQH